MMLVVKSWIAALCVMMRLNWGKAIRDAQAADIATTTGGASVGERDLVQTAARAGMDLNFWKIAHAAGKTRSMECWAECRFSAAGIWCRPLLCPSFSSTSILRQSWGDPAGGCAAPRLPFSRHKYARQSTARGLRACYCVKVGGSIYCAHLRPRLFLHAPFAVRIPMR